MRNLFKYSIILGVIVLTPLRQPVMAGLTNIVMPSEPSRRQVMANYANSLVREDLANATSRQNELAQRAMARIASGLRITRADDEACADAVRRRIVAGVRLESQRDGLDQQAQRSLLIGLANDTRERLRIAKRAGDAHAICGQTTLLEYFESRLCEIREAEERDKASSQQIYLMGMTLVYLRDLSIQLLDSTLTTVERTRLQERYDRVRESLPHQPLKNRVQMNRALEEFKNRAALRNITLRNINVVGTLDNSQMAHIIRLAMQS